MRRWLRQLLLLVLCITLMPGWVELLENVEHLLHDGHLAHQSEHVGDEHVEAHAALEAEHGCTPVSHICGCHASMPVLLPGLDLDLAMPRVVTGSARPMGHDDPLVHRAQAPPVPPPIA